MLLYIDNLFSKGAGPLSAQTRDQCLTLIGRYDLLATHPRVWSLRDRLYEALMRVVLDGPVTYERYLRLQESMKTPIEQNAALLQALNRRRTAADPTWLLIRRGIGDTEEDLVNALARNSVPAGPGCLPNR